MAICGTAMASLAAMLKAKGHDVYGVDEGVYPPMSTFLQEQGIPVYQGFDPAHLDPAPDLVIVGNVISRGNVEVEEVLDRHIPYTSLPSALAEFFIRGKRSIVVTGTHGKTTTTSLLAWIFDWAGRNPGFMVGGIPKNFGRGFQVGDGEDFIVEGDEYDSAFFDKVAKFLRYLPDIGIINGIEYDHADIYGSIEEIELAFQRFINLIPRSGLLVVNREDARAMELSRRAFCPVADFGLTAEAMWSAEDIEVDSEGTSFTVVHRRSPLGRVRIPLYGRHNVRNALAAMAVSHWVGIDFNRIRSALAGFEGVKRRLEKKGEARGVEIFDDFGHHPTAVRETLEAFRHKYPEREIWAVFEPRTATTRRAVFQKEFANAFQAADVVIVAPVHRPDKVPDGRVFSPELLVEDLRNQKKRAYHFPSVDEIVQWIAEHVQGRETVVTFSNGPFGNIHEKLLLKLAQSK